MEFVKKPRYDIEDMKAIMRLLRSENGCPWDREQTHATIRNNLIEEAYEVIEAIDQCDSAMLREELGDLLLQIIFHSEMESEQSVFNFDDVVDEICQKLITRHPHVFADVSVKDSDEVLSNWTAIKQQQKGQNTYTQTLESVPRQLPAIMRADKVQSRAGKAGFCYPTVEMAMEDLESELDELKAAIAANDRENIEEELGDLLFSVVNVSRLLKYSGEEALTRSTDKFVQRFSLSEEIAREQGMSMPDTDLDTLNKLWAEAKRRIQEE